jgi:ribose transport system ATP-binding protein
MSLIAMIPTSQVRIADTEASEPPAEVQTPLLSVAHVSKTFPGQVALDDVSITINQNEIYGLLGQNGSGKSTFIKILAGFHEPDPGSQARFLGGEISLGHHGGAWRHRAHFVHQDLALIPTLDTVENLALEHGFRTGRLGRIDWKGERARASALLASFGLEFDVSLPTGKLSPAHRTTVAIIRALQAWDGSAGLLVLDEATAALPPAEVSRLFQFLRSLVERGASILFVSHRLEEIVAITDRVGVLRDGALIAEYATRDIDKVKLVSLIAGNQGIKEVVQAESKAPGPVTLRIEHLAGDSLVDLSFELRAGEVLGITGILGSGREEVAQILSGANRPNAGVIYLDGQELPSLNPRIALAKGIALVPTDRAAQGLIQSFPIRENLTLPWLAPLARYTCILPGRERKETLRWIDKVRLVPREPERAAGQLSGGNQQKVVIAKSLRTSPKILVLDDPTQGVDVGAKAAIHRLILDAAASGTGVILCSVEADDLVGLCDRVLVLRDGRVVAELAGEELSEHQLLLTTLRVDASSAGTPEDVHPMSQASPRNPTTAAAAAANGPAALPVNSEGRSDLTAPRDPVFTTSTVADAATTSSHQHSATGFEVAFEWAIRSFQNFSAVYILVALIILFGVWMPNTFLTATTLKTLLPQQAVTAMLSVGLVVALAAGVFDLSIAGTLGLSAIVVTKLMVDTGMAAPVAIAVALGVGILIGAVNALLIVVCRIDSFIATLAMQSVLAAMVLAVSGNVPAIGVPESFAALGSSGPLSVPLPVWYLIIVALVTWYVLEHTAVGRRIYATGGGREAARLAGVEVNRIVVASLLTASIVAAFAGIVVTARLGAGSPAIGPSYLLPAYAAAFLGATQVHRGRFNVWGTILAVYVLAVGVKGLQLAGAPFWIPDLFNGVALALAVGLSGIQARSRRRRVRAAEDRVVTTA